MKWVRVSIGEFSLACTRSPSHMTTQLQVGYVLNVKLYYDSFEGNRFLKRLLSCGKLKK